MCFSSKMKVPKPTPEQLKAPEPVLLEPPKGVDVGDGADDDVTKDDSPVVGRKGLTVEKDKGDGSTAAKSIDTGGVKKSPAIKRALKR